MPVTTGPACLSNETCPVSPMPTIDANCGGKKIAQGGVNDLYFIPCTETLSEANILDVAWWTALKTAGNLGNIGEGIGSIAKLSEKKEKTGSCKTEEIISITWGLKYVIKKFDKTSADKTRDQMNALLQRSSNFQLIARMCDGSDKVLPVGSFQTSGFNWTVPESNEDARTVELELSWTEFGIPKEYTVAGLSAIIPKA
jgi:hypothetical protein